ncbi:MAG: helix-turn-helix domain-containing protein [Acidimicrobiia bacterium]|nr:helix-turn-helix domain-containing protein [Acidimicrobiia bacterium]
MRQTLDPLVFGHRLRHFRRQRGLTLDQLGDLVGKPAPYLSMVETGKREPKLSLIGDLADALGVAAVDLLSHEAPSHRSHLEVMLARAQEEELYGELGLPQLKPTAKTPDLALEHIVGLYEALRRRTIAESITHDVARDVTAELRREAKERGNHEPAIEALAAEALATIDYPGTGPLSQRNVIDLAQGFGYTVHTVPEFPPTARAIADRSNGRLYIPQRNELRTRAARSVILQAIGHAALGHTEPVDFVDFLRQRLEANYFAGAVLIPETPAVEFLAAAKERRDLSVGDLKELFYASYEMAAHRFTNLATEHLSIPVHFLRTDEEGIIRRSYENDHLPLPTDANGIVDGHRACKEFAARKAIRSEYAYDIYYQYTDTPEGTYWSSAHIEADRTPSHVITVGTDFEHARWFRGRGTDHHAVSHCPAAECCSLPPPDLRREWDARVWPVPKSVSHLLAALPVDPFPGVDMHDAVTFVDGLAP